MTTNQENPLERLLATYHGLGNAAIQLGVSRQTIETWLKRGHIPFKRGEYVEKKTEGTITALEIWQAATKFYT